MLAALMIGHHFSAPALCRAPQAFAQAIVDVDRF
jgi:hypothetical protein